MSPNEKEISHGRYRGKHAGVASQRGRWFHRLVRLSRDNTLRRPASGAQITDQRHDKEYCRDNSDRKSDYTADDPRLNRCLKKTVSGGSKIGRQSQARSMKHKRQPTSAADEKDTTEYHSRDRLAPGSAHRSNETQDQRPRELELVFACS
jgi:hypothetical protein